MEKMHTTFDGRVKKQYATSKPLSDLVAFAVRLMWHLAVGDEELR